MAFSPTTWRKPHGVLGYLWIDRPSAVFKARADVPDGQIYPTREINWDGATLGAYTDVLPGMTVLLGTTEGADDLGRQRVKSSQPTFLEIGWTSIGTHDGELLIPDNSYITVLDQRLVWEKTPYISILSGEQFKDFDLTFSAATAQPPVSNCGIGYANFVDPLTNLITVDFDSTNSFPVNPLSLLGSVLWDIADGTITVGVDSDQFITVTFPIGRRYISLTVTDDGGRSHTSYALIVAAERTGANAPFNVDAQLQISAEGTKATFTLYEDADTADYPDGTLVMFWVEEFYDGVQGSLAGQTNREHMRFIGYIHNEPTSVEAGENALQRKTTLECLDVAGKLATLPGFPQEIKRITSPTNWYEMYAANVDRFLHYLLHWHSTALELTDFYWSASGDTYAFGSFSSDGATLYQQVDGRAQATGTGFRFTSDSQGILRVVPNPQYQETGDRTSTVIVALTEDDIQDYGYRQQRPPRVHWIRASALKVTTAELTAQDIVWAIAPGAAPGQGESAQEIGNRLVISQSQLNTFLGNFYAVQNAPQSQLNVTLAHGGFAGIEPALGQWLTLTTTAANAPHRGLVFATERFLPLSVTLNFDSAKGTCEQSLTVEREIIGQAASVYVPPTANLPGYVPPSEYFGEVLDMGDTGFAGVTNFALFATDGMLYRSAGFADPTWTQFDLGLTGTLSGFVVDAFSPLYLGTGSTVNGWLATWDTDGVRVYGVYDIFNATPTVTLLFTSASVPYDFAYIATERQTQNFVVVTWYSTANGAMSGYSTNGTTFTESAVSAFKNSVLSTGVDTPVVYVVGGGVAYAAAFTANGADDAAAGGIYKTLDSGATWAYSHGTLKAALGFSLHVPFANNPSKDKMWYQRRQLTGDNKTRCIYFDGSTEHDYSPIVGSDTVGQAEYNRSLATNPTNSDQVFLCGTDHNGNLSSHKSTDGGLSWTEVDQSAFAGLKGCDIASNGDVYVFGLTGDIGLIPNFGDTILDRRANLLTDFPSVGTIIGIAGG